MTKGAATKNLIYEITTWRRLACRVGLSWLRLRPRICQVDKMSAFKSPSPNTLNPAPTAAPVRSE
jgi:hypothetical protein